MVVNDCKNPPVSGVAYHRWKTRQFLTIAISWYAIAFTSLVVNDLIFRAWVVDQSTSALIFNVLKKCINWGRWCIKVWLLTNRKSALKSRWLTIKDGDTMDTDREGGAADHHERKGAQQWATSTPWTAGISVHAPAYSVGQQLHREMDIAHRWQATEAAHSIYAAPAATDGTTSHTASTRTLKQLESRRKLD